MKRFFSYVAFVAAVAIQLQALALTPGVQKLVEYETQANAAAVRSNKAIPLPHVEIPLQMISVDFAKNLDPAIAASLVFEKNGEKYVRWILNPEDTKWGAELMDHFKARGVDMKVHHHFTGYQTASRSYIAEDPTTGAQFSVKSSTNVTGGNWKDKKQPIGEAVDGRLISDFLADQNKKRPFENFVVMHEPAILKAGGLDQAVVIRDLSGLKSKTGKFTYLPGFSALHEKVGAEIALRNGSDDPFKYWTEHYVKVAGRALGELAARTGLQFDSPHSQNFLVELDENMKPTGRLVLRDMSDLWVDQSYMKAIYGEDAPILKQFNQKENILSRIQAGFGPLHGNQKPKWANGTLYSFWKFTFFESFEESFRKISGYDLKGLNANGTQFGDYFLATYKLSDREEFKGLYEMLKKDGYVRSRGASYRCETAHAAGL